MLAVRERGGPVKRDPFRDNSGISNSRVKPGKYANVGVVGEGRSVDLEWP